MLKSRMPNPALTIPEALPTLLALGKCTMRAGIPAQTHALVHLRASQINGCGFCVDMHAKELKKAGASDERIFAVAAWREAPYYTDAERAALALAEAATRLADREDAVPDAIWSEATRHYDPPALSALLLSIALVNLWNRLNVATAQVAGAPVPG
jgi:AhpD family alkylhydroperoxidase